MSITTFLDEEHSLDEERYITIGLSDTGRLLLVAHAERNDRIRMISARKATKNEEKFYNVVVLDPEIAKAFPDDEAVNEALWLVLKASKIPHSS